MRTRVPSILLLALFVNLFSFSSFSQSIGTPDGKVELGLGIGPMFFLGDLGGTRGEGKTFIKDLNLPTTKVVTGLYANIYPAEWIGFRIAANVGALAGDDAFTTPHNGEEMDRLQRNLKFKSKLLEAYFATEFYPTVLFENYDGLLHKLRPYGVLGVGVFHFNPKGEYINPDGTTQWVDLKPLRLEGQGMAEYPNRKPYSLTQLEIPMGFGFKYYVSDNVYIGFEVLHRKTFTDYIDDVSTTYIDPSLFDVYLSPQQATWAKQLEYREKLKDPSINRPWINEQRGDPKQNDAFFSFTLRFGWRLSSVLERGIRNQMRCPLAR